MPELSLRKLSIVSALALSSSAIAAQATPPPAASAVEVTTRDGAVRGTASDGVATFLGIPYAAPPVGEARWKPPLPVAPHGPIDATRFASNCPQMNELGVFTGPPSIDEDCLYLNVYAPTGDDGASPKPRPVIVWFHGGGNTTGTASDYDGSRLARGGDGTPASAPTISPPQRQSAPC